MKIISRQTLHTIPQMVRQLVKMVVMVMTIRMNLQALMNTLITDTAIPL